MARRLLAVLVLASVMIGSAAMAGELPVMVEDALLSGNWQTAFDIIAGDSASLHNPVARMASAQCCVALNLCRESRVLLESVTEVNDVREWSRWADSLVVRHPQSAVAWCLKGDADYRAGTLSPNPTQALDTAVAAFSEAIRLDSSQPVFYTGRALVYIAAGRYPDAINDENTAIDLDSNFAEAYFNRAASYERMKEFDKALDEYGKVLTICPNSARAQLFRAGVYQQMAEYDLAVMSCDRALLMDSLYFLALYVKGLTYDKAGAVKPAIATYEQFLERVPRCWRGQARRAARRVEEMKAAEGSDQSE